MVWFRRMGQGVRIGRLYLSICSYNGGRQVAVFRAKLTDSETGEQTLFGTMVLIGWQRYFVGGWLTKDGIIKYDEIMNDNH